MRVLDLLARRARSEWEIRDYLKHKDYDNSAIDQIINKLTEKGYIDDQKFARAWVDNRRLLKSVSKRKLWTELKQKHVADDIIKIVLEDDATDERQVIRDLVVKKRHQTRYQDDTKLMQYLSRQGFKYDDIKVALSE
jgi:regulatory protein